MSKIPSVKVTDETFIVRKRDFKKPKKIEKSGGKVKPYDIESEDIWPYHRNKSIR